MKFIKWCIIGTMFLSGLNHSIYAQPIGGDNSMKNCLTILVGKDVSADGSVLLGHNEDLFKNTCMHLHKIPRMSHEPEAIRMSYYGAQIRLPEETFAYVCLKVFKENWVPGDFAGGINEFQVSIANNLAYSKEASYELKPSSNVGQLLWSEFMHIALENAKNASEAVTIIGALVHEYGLALDPGTMFGITDPHECWWIEIGWKQWVAKKVPSNKAEMRANYFRIETDFDMHSPDLFECAIENGWYNPEIDVFNWKDVYGDTSSEGWADWNWLRETRADSLLNEYASNTISRSNIMRILRDHYEGTSYDETEGYTHGSPHNFSKYWTICNEISVESFISQSRNWLPNEIGGIIWTAFSRPCASVYIPWHVGIRDTPIAFRTGSNRSFKVNSAWWAFETLARELDKGKRYSEKIHYVQDIWQQYETKEFQEVMKIEKYALILYEKGDLDAVNDILTVYSANNGLRAMGQVKQIKQELK